MRIPNALMMAAGGLITPFAVTFFKDTVTTMLPWITVMFAVVVCDLIAGLRKSLKLGVHISWSMAFRETMGKLVVYFSFVMMVAMIDAASEHTFKIALWGCLLVCAIEFGSVISNILKPYGVDITYKGIVKIFVKGKLGVDDADAAELVGEEENLEELRQREEDRWERHHKYRHGAKVEHDNTK